jgi:hypothetical protein
METQTWLISGFQTMVLLYAWAALVALHVVWRAAVGIEEDEIRPSGPID